MRARSCSMPYVQESKGSFQSSCDKRFRLARKLSQPQFDSKQPLVNYETFSYENLVMCTKCGKWVGLHGRCAKIKRVTSTAVNGFVCKLCVDTKEEIVEPGKEI